MNVVTTFSLFVDALNVLMATGDAPWREPYYERRLRTSAMKRHILHAVLRVALAVGVLIALPFSHMQWGEPYPGDGQKAFGFIAIFVVIGLVAAVLFVALGSLAQFLLRKRSPLYTVLVDVGLFVAFAGALVYGGLTAKYSDAPPNHALGEPGHRAPVNTEFVRADRRRTVGP